MDNFDVSLFVIVASNYSWVYDESEELVYHQEGNVIPALTKEEMGPAITAYYIPEGPTKFTTFLAGQIPAENGIVNLGDTSVDLMTMQSLVEDYIDEIREQYTQDEDDDD